MKRELTFDNFFVYEGNQVAFLAAKKIVDFPGELFNPLYIYGNTGLGKTHLLWALFSELNRKATLLFFSAKEFESYIDKAKVFNTPFIVDDIHMVSSTYQEKILGIVDTFLANNRQICFSGSSAPRELKNFDMKLISRIEGGLVCDIAPPKEMALIDMIKKKSGEAGILLPDEIALELAQISTGSIRTIEGMINRLIAYSSLGNVSLDVDSARMILKEFYPKGIYSPVSSLLEELKKNASEILEDVSEKMDVRDEYKEKIYIWEMKGFDISSLSVLLEGNIEVLKAEYDSFIEKVERLISLQKEFGALDTSKCIEDAMKVESMLFSPDRLDEIEQLIARIKQGGEEPDKTKSFDTLIVGESNKKAYEIYREQVIPSLGEKYNPFIVFGSEGRGKTRFLEAIRNDLLSLKKNVKFIDLEISEGIPQKGLLSTCDALLIDNFHLVFSYPQEKRQSLIDRLLELVNEKKAIIVSSEIFSSAVAFNDQERLFFEYGIEAELMAPDTTVARTYISSRLPSETSDMVLRGDFPPFKSFREANQFIEDIQKGTTTVEVKVGAMPAEEQEAAQEQTRATAAEQPVAKAEITPEVVPLGLEGEEELGEGGAVQDVTETQPAAEELVPLGLEGETAPGETTGPAGQETGAAAISATPPEEEAQEQEAPVPDQETSEITSRDDETKAVETDTKGAVPAGVRTSILEAEPVMERRDERFIIQDILGELLEDNY
jgi:chromosomal replication initiation ATPase DnaA